ncbi:hypothetical protein UlMin_042491, partial [Ulmus minor]
LTTVAIAVGAVGAIVAMAPIGVAVRMATVYLLHFSSLIFFSSFIKCELELVCTQLSSIYYPYLAVLNFSQTWALYCLVQFYSVTKEKLAPTKHLAKFLVFKSIVFLTWWQGIAVAFLFSMGAFKGALAQELKTCMQDYIICIEMGVATVVHLYVFLAIPYKWGERCVRNVAVLDDYASLGSPPDPEEVHDCERSTRIRLACHDEREKCLNFHQSIRDMVLGSGEIIVDDMKYTASHVMEPVERGIAKINKNFHEISENVKCHEALRRNSKDDSYLIPISFWTREFSEVQDSLVEGSVSDSGMSSAKKLNQRASASRNKSGR